jgi:hypothetical protein
MLLAHLVEQALNLVEGPNAVVLPVGNTVLLICEWNPF